MRLFKPLTCKMMQPQILKRPFQQVLLLLFSETAGMFRNLPTIRTWLKPCKGPLSLVFFE
ncbi:hypothetical protein TH606_09350 [Thermodesulfatator autotrophicus]|uniref:Uncharacterized protein n=1 Tax=Thermodesulfatator autotrophicus TaxID=1795632 RepID=A0A177E664_9BACT|nr:hypothetical protein TH606_09350 [Thermodesulfatator autotrophicus]